MRHHFITEAVGDQLEAGALSVKDAVETVSTTVGHASPQMTSYYTHETDRIRNAVVKARENSLLATLDEDEL